MKLECNLFSCLLSDATFVLSWGFTKPIPHLFCLRIFFYVESILSYLSTRFYCKPVQKITVEYNDV